MSETICYKCRKPGHFARECQQSGTDRNNNTQQQRMFRDANRSNGGPSSSTRCFKCNRTGHWARECRESSDRCYKCNKPGHLAKDCENNVEAGSCYNCGQVGHLQRDCKLATAKTCYKCKESGHLAKVIFSSLFLHFFLDLINISFITNSLFAVLIYVNKTKFIFQEIT